MGLDTLIGAPQGIGVMCDAVLLAEHWVPLGRTDETGESRLHPRRHKRVGPNVYGAWLRVLHSAPQSQRAASP